MTSAAGPLLCTFMLLWETTGIYGYEITRTHNLGDLKSHTYTLDVDLRVTGNIRLKNNDNSATIVMVRKSAQNELNLGNIDVKVTVDETNKIIKVKGDVTGQVGDSAGSTTQFHQLLPVLLALWWGVTFAPRDSRFGTLLGVVATFLMLLCYSGTGAVNDDGPRADVTIATPIHMVMLGAILSARDGLIQITPGHMTYTSCVSGTPPTGECDMCCYGTGACDAGTCFCNPGFSGSDNCRTSIGTETDPPVGNGTTVTDPPVGGTIRVIITVENNVTDDAREFTFCTTAEASSGLSAFDIFNQTAHDNPAFSIESKSFGSLGYYVSMVNGLEEDSDNSLYWGFGRRTPEGDCLFPVGASSYYPVNLDHLLFTYITYDMFNMFSTCAVQNENITLNFEYNLHDRCYNAK